MPHGGGPTRLASAVEVGAGELRVQRWLVNLTVRDYTDATSAFLSKLAEQDDLVQRWWCDRRLGVHAFTPHPVKPLHSRRDVEDVVHEAGLRELSEPDCLVLVVTGHGRIGPSMRHYLRLPETQPDRLLATGFPTVEVVGAALASDAEHVVVIVNACHAGQLRGELDALVRDLPPDRQRLESLAVFVTGRFDERPRVVDLRELLGRVERQLRATSGIARPLLSVEEFRAELVRAARADPPLLDPILVWPLAGGEQPSPCLPNPGFDAVPHAVTPALQQAATPEPELDYWLDRASGRVSETDPGWYFAGRVALTSSVAAFLREGDGLFVVTGGAGTGKSAVIARAVTLSDPRLRADPRYLDAVAAAPAQTLPPPGSIDAAVLARQKDARTVAADLLHALGNPAHAARAGEDPAQALRRQLAAAITARQRRCTLVIDGLDEAIGPQAVITEQLGPLLRLTDAQGRRLVRLLVGVRSSAGPGSDHGLLDLLDRVAHPIDVRIVRTDGPDARGDVAGYVEALLAGPGGPYAAPDARTARRAAAEAVATAVVPSFLDARLAGQRLREAAYRQRLGDPEWQATLDEGTIGLLRADLAELADDDPADATELLAVLRAAAFARGAGVPWAEVWPAMAEAVLDRPLTDPDAVIARVLAGRLTGYLTRDVEHDRIVYRPAHDLLAVALRQNPDRLLEQP
jgi:AAA domain